MTPHSLRLAGAGSLLLAALAIGYSGHIDSLNPASAVADPAAVDEPSPDDLDVALEWVRRDLDAKDQVAGEVIAGRLRLTEAAARFRALEAVRPNRYCDPHLELIPGDSEGERLCRKVIGHVQGCLHWFDPAREQEVTAGLEAELRDELARDGTVRLPEPPPSGGRPRPE
jgi:hypothetical protein